MMMGKHTPGPWHAMDNNWQTSTIYGPSGEVVAACVIYEDVAEGGEDSFEMTKEANARLIAVAPDLLAALIDLRDLILDTVIDGGINARSVGIDATRIKAADAAIAKATGDGS